MNGAKHMDLREAPRGLCSTLCVLIAAANLVGQTPQGEPRPGPQIGQPGKDIVWLPTPHPLVERMLDLARVTPADHVIDLGSGDGRIVIAAAKRGASALGTEYNPALVELSVARAVEAGVADKTRFVEADLFESDLAEASVVTMFLGSVLNLRLRERLLALKPGTRIVSSTFTMAEWEADETLEVSHLCSSWCRAFLWIVPARVQGTWELPAGQLRLEQAFQMVTGTYMLDGRSVSITRGRLLGDQITFHAGAVRFTGRVTGTLIEGTYEFEAERGGWTATRVAG